jgi:hypothetical protein
MAESKRGEIKIGGLVIRFRMGKRPTSGRAKCYASLVELSIASAIFEAARPRCWRL